jgi:ribosomal-protein-alanine N-acetyltransferase
MTNAGPKSKTEMIKAKTEDARINSGLTNEAEEIRIRLAEEKDLPDMARIEADNFSEPWSLKGFQDALNLPETARLFTAVDEKDHLLGYLVLYFTDFDGELETVAVEKGFRGHGIGGALLSAMLDFGREKNLEQIVLEVRPSNEPALALYKARGFLPCGVRKNFYNFPTEDAIVMSYSFQ